LGVLDEVPALGLVLALVDELVPIPLVVPVGLVFIALFVVRPPLPVEVEALLPVPHGRFEVFWPLTPELLGEADGFAVPGLDEPLMLELPLMPPAPPLTCAKARPLLPAMRAAVKIARVDRLFANVCSSGSPPKAQRQARVDVPVGTLIRRQLRRPLFAARGSVAAAVVRRVASHAIIRRLGAKHCGREAFGGEAALEQFADCRGAARHALLKTEFVDDLQFLGRQHNL
jgi:hypothetical protein